MYIRKRKRGDTITCNTSFYNQKKLFDMVKDTKSYPTLEQGGVKKVLFTEYQLITNENLTAIP
jgi:hypothetical protein